MAKNKRIRVLDLDDATLKDARKAGFKRKKPRVPKNIKTDEQYNRYAERYNDYVKAAQEKAEEYRKAQEVKKAVQSNLKGLK